MSVEAWTSLAGIDHIDRCHLSNAGNLAETVSWRGLSPPDLVLSSEVVSHPRMQSVAFLG